MAPGNSAPSPDCEKMFITVFRGTEKYEPRNCIKSKWVEWHHWTWSSVGWPGAHAKCRRDANNSSAKPRLPEFLAQSRTMPAGLLGSICYSLSDNGSGVPLEGNGLTGRREDEANSRSLALKSCTWVAAFNSLWHLPSPYCIPLRFLLVFSLPFMEKCHLWPPQLSQTRAVYTQTKFTQM